MLPARIPTTFVWFGKRIGIVKGNRAFAIRYQLTEIIVLMRLRHHWFYFQRFDFDGRIKCRVTAYRVTPTPVTVPTNPLVISLTCCPNGGGGGLFGLTDSCGNSGADGCTSNVAASLNTV